MEAESTLEGTVGASREEARQVAKECAELLSRRFGATRVMLFGSAAGDAPWHARSDLDLAVEGLRPEDYLAALTACYELLPRGVELDLVPLESAWPELRARILGEVDMPADSVQALRFEIESEFRNLERMVERVQENLAAMVAEPREIEVQGLAKYVHDFYNGVERIFERIAVRLDGDLPAGPSCHTRLLQRMGQPFPDVRPAVIDRALETELVDYLRFRHLFRHTYGYDLEWKRVQELSHALPDALEALKTQLTDFLASLEAQVPESPDNRP